MFYFIYSWIKNCTEETDSQSINFIINIVTSFVMELTLGIFGYCNVQKFFKNKKKYIEEETQKALNKALNNDDN